MTREEKIEKEYLEGKSLTVIAKENDLSRWLVTKQIRELGYTIVNEQNKLRLDENYFNKIDSEEKAYWLGFMFADGCVSSKNNAIELSLQLGDLAHLEKFKKAINFTGNLYTDNFRCRLCFSNKQIKQDLIRLGCTPNKSLTLEYPKDIVGYDIAFIRGYFDGDGYLGTIQLKNIVRTRMSLLGTESMLNNIKQLSNITSVLKHDKRHNDAIKYFILSGPNSDNFIETIYSNATIFLDRKYAKYEYAVCSRNITND